MNESQRVTGRKFVISNSNLLPPSRLYCIDMSVNGNSGLVILEIDTIFIYNPNANDLQIMSTSDSPMSAKLSTSSNPCFRWHHPFSKLCSSFHNKTPAR